MTSLFLVHHDEVDVAVVIVHEQTVAQELVAGVGMEIKSVGLVFERKSCIEHVALIFALRVLVWLSHHLHSFQVKHSVRICFLIDELIIVDPVERKAVIWSEHKSEPASRLVHVVSSLSSQLILVESVRSIIESSHRECQFVVEFCIMRHFGIAVEMCAYAKIHIRSLIVHRILGVLTHESTFSVDTIESTLWSPEHIYAVELIGVGVERTLIHQWNVINIHTHRWAVDT